MSVEEVAKWLCKNGFAEFSTTFKENKVDGEALSYMTERGLESLIPQVGCRMRFLKLLDKFKKGELNVTMDANETQGEMSESEELEVRENSSQRKNHAENGECNSTSGANETPAEMAEPEELVEVGEKTPQSKKTQSGALPVSPDATVVLNARLPWPAVLQLPTNYRPEVAKVLLSSDRTLVTKKFRRSFITSLFDHFSRYTLYPSKHQLTEISELVIRKYPMLKDQAIGTGYVSIFNISIYEAS
ncbi:uncharacterized protein LOC114575838 [Exaiptasia diaphana]|uniref:SAM domain-containing protein n=1 Tax=Exaiptasia diaphana TaxID=2652724 RepID=A0A913YRX4_EXADI|nr:uncharacterized protein LOC114575838 [Exaiptasia diaphana]